VLLKFVNMALGVCTEVVGRIQCCLKSILLNDAVCRG
jgi:hypothetical protein